VEPVRVHYAGAYTGYGPVVAGPKGLSYFTLRARTDPGAQFLPGARDKMPKGLKRHLLAKAWPPLPAADLATIGGSEAKDLWGPQPDGIGAWMLRVAPNRAATAPARAGATHYLLVISGALIMNGERLPRFAAIFISGNDTPALCAAEEGMELLVLQFPVPQEERP
jgi:redox-sensitive bicupin YhaK (pirin superfamily)